MLNLFLEPPKTPRKKSCLHYPRRKGQNEVQAVPSGGVGLGWQMGTHAALSPVGLGRGVVGLAPGCSNSLQLTSSGRWKVQENPCLLCPALHPW